MDSIIVCQSDRLTQYTKSFTQSEDCAEILTVERARSVRDERIGWMAGTCECLNVKDYQLNIEHKEGLSVQH